VADPSLPDKEECTVRRKTTLLISETKKKAREDTSDPNIEWFFVGRNMELDFH
jgi:hypothetical protein